MTAVSRVLTCQVSEVTFLYRWKQRTHITLQDSAWGSIVKIGNIYHILYTKHDGKGWKQIRRAISTDLKFWRDQGPVDFTCDDLNHRVAPAILKNLDGYTAIRYDDKYWLICQEFENYEVLKLYFATSIDGTWTYEKDILSKGNIEGPDDDAIFTACFFKDEDTYNIFYQGRKAADLRWRICYANCSKPNGTWYKASNNPTLEPTLPWEENAVIDPCVRKEANTYYLFYSGNIANHCFNSYATSQSLDGKWAKSDEKITRKGISYPEIVKHNDNRYYLNGDDLNYSPARARK